MATIDLGRLGFVNKGTYNNSTTYEKNDLVQFTDGGVLSTYLYIDSTAQSGQAPSSSGTVGSRWVYFAKGVADAVAGAGNNKVLVTDGSGNLSPLSVGSAGQSLKVNSGANGFEFGTISSDFVKLATVTANGSSGSVSLDGYFSSTYKNYEIYCYNVKSSSGRASWRLNLSGSASSGNSYYSIGNQAYGGSGGGNYNSAQPQDWGANKWQFTHNTDDNATAPHHAIIRMFDPLNSSNLTQGFAQAMGFNNTQHDHFVYGFLFNNTTAPTGVTFLSNSGNITGEFTLYGLKV